MCLFACVFIKVLLKLPASYKMLGEQRRLFRIARKWLFSLAVHRSIVLAFPIQFIWATRFIITYWQGYFSSWIFLFSAVLWAHTTSLTLYLTSSVAIFTPPLGLLELVDDITAFIPTIHHPLKRKQEMTTLYSPQWWLCLMLNLHYSYWNKSLSSAIHHQSQRSFIRIWKTPF